MKKKIDLVQKSSKNEDLKNFVETLFTIITDCTDRQCIAMTMTRAVIARRIIFLILFFIFLREVILSSLKWYRGDIGTLNEKDGADHVTYPSLSLCLVPIQIEENMVS